MAKSFRDDLWLSTTQGSIQEYDLQVPGIEVDQYEIKKASALSFKRWFRRR